MQKPVIFQKTCTCCIRHSQINPKNAMHACLENLLTCEECGHRFYRKFETFITFLLNKIFSSFAFSKPKKTPSTVNKKTCVKAKRAIDLPIPTEPPAKKIRTNEPTNDKTEPKIESTNENVKKSGRNRRATEKNKQKISQVEIKTETQQQNTTDFQSHGQKIFLFLDNENKMASNAEIERLNILIDGLQTKLLDLDSKRKKELDHVFSEQEALKVQLKEIEAKRNNLKTELEKVFAENESLEEQLKNSNDKVKVAETKIANISKGNETLKSNLEELQKKHDQLKKENVQLQNVDAENDTLRGKLEDSNIRIANLEGQVSKMKEANASLKSSKDELQKEVEKLKIDKVEQDLVMGSKVVKIEGKYNQLEKYAKEKKKVLIATQAEVKTLQVISRNFFVFSLFSNR